MTAPIIIETAAFAVKSEGPSSDTTQGHAENSQSVSADALLQLSGTRISERDGIPSGDAEQTSPTQSHRVSDVGTVVAKAKRAASSLWLLLHAQVRSHDGGHILPLVLAFVSLFQLTPMPPSSLL